MFGFSDRRYPLLSAQLHPNNAVPACREAVRRILVPADITPPKRPRRDGLERGAMQGECESPLVVAMEGDADRSRVRSGRRRSPPQFRHFSQPAQLLWVAEALAAAAPGRACPVAGYRPPVSRATADAWPRRRAHPVSHRHVCDQLRVQRRSNPVPKARRALGLG